MEGFRKPVYVNFIRDRSSHLWFHGLSKYQCTVCGATAIVDRTHHNNTVSCGRAVWADPLGVMLETAEALWGGV